MKYTCETCNYETGRKNDFVKHNSTKRHLSKLKSNSFGTEMEHSSHVCRGCGASYKYQKSLLRHQKECTLDSFVKTKEGEADDAYNDLQKRYNKIVEEMTKLINNTSGNSNLVDKFEEFEDNILNLISNKNDNQSAFSFIKDNFTTAPPLEKIKVEEVSQLEFIRDVLSKENGEFELCEILQHHVLHDTLEVYFSEFFLDKYLEKDKKKQQLFVTDCSRLSYIVRDLVDKKAVWKRDNKGIIVADRLIHPILEYIKEHLSEYTHRFLDKVFCNVQEKLDAVDKIHRLMTVTKHIDNGSLAKKILKHLAPSFKLNEIKINHNQIDVNLIKHKKRTKNKSKKTKITKVTTKRRRSRKK